MFNLDHLGIVVASLLDAVPVYCQLLGLAESEVEYHEVLSERVRVAMLKGNTTIELLEPTVTDSPLARYLEKRGPGFHHYAIAVPPPLESKLAELQQAGFQLLDKVPRTGAEGRVFFVHPKSANGILTEFVERSSD